MKKALLIGINYTNTSAQLAGCINDIYNVRDFLVQYCGYDLNNIKILSDKDIIPTRNNIEMNISWLISNCLAGDTLFFHYSGHGAFVRDTSNDETDGRDEVLVPIDYAYRGVITDDWLMQNFISKIPSQVTLWAFVDACHSGTVLDLKHNFKSNCALRQGKIEPQMAYVSKNWTDRFLYSIEKSREVQGTICLFSGALDAEFAADAFLNNSPQGAFTCCLLECLNKNLVTMSNGSKRFKPDTLKLRNILKEVNCLLDIKGFKQNTQLSVSSKDFERMFNP